MAHTTTKDLTPDPARWAEWFDKLLTRLDWPNVKMAKALGVTNGTVGTWRTGKYIASPNQIRAMLQIPEVAELVTPVEAFLAAGVLWESDLRERERARTPLSEYSLAELNFELHERVKRIAADLETAGAEKE